MIIKKHNIIQSFWQQKWHIKRHQEAPAANISLLVLFILIVTSLLWLMATTMISNMQESSRIFEHGQKAFYAARGGIEYWLTQVSLNERWYQESSIFTWDQGKRSSIIDARHDNETRWKQWLPLQKRDCESDNAFSLSGGSSLVIPLFVWDDSRARAVSNMTIVPIKKWNIALWLSLDDNTPRDDELYMTWTLASDRISLFMQWKTLNLTQWQHYLLMTALDQEIQFCLSHEWQWDIASDWISVTWKWQFWESIVSLTARQFNPLPDYIYNLSIVR